MDTLRFYFVTWNVATRAPEQDLNSLLDFPSQYNKNKPLPDFYVIGLQEVKSQPQNLIMDSLFSDPWTSTLSNVLCRQGYILSKSIRLQGLLLLLYTQMKHVTHLRDLEAQYTKTGLGGMWGNKGAVSVRFNIYGCSICLVNCHLTAHEHLLADRISDYNTILKDHSYHVRETINILCHDYVFWIGDLNFRTDHPTGGSPTAEEIVAALQKIEKDKYTSLLKHDQLLAVTKSGEAFSEFTEPEIKFPPTYKFLIGGDEYDVKRKPSWTDRILYKVIPNTYENVTLRADVISYNHMQHYSVSDHKPVIAQFTIKSYTPGGVIVVMDGKLFHDTHGKKSGSDFPLSSIPVLLQIRQSFTRLVTASEPPRITRSAIRMRSAIVAPGVAEIAKIAEGASGSGCSTIDAPLVEDEASVSNQVFANYTEKTVEFAPISRIWYIGDADFRTQCTLSPDVVVNPNDWIGIFDANFRSLDDYIAYEYLSKVSLPHEGKPGEPRTITLSFPVGSGVRIPGFYRFIYFSQPSGEVKSVLGISEPFEVSSKDDQVTSLDSGVQPTSSTSPASSKPTSTTADIFTDFTTLDVASLSRHFSNDLSID